MPTLDWIGKRAVVNHHKTVPFHLLQQDPGLSVGDPESGNLIVEGDNLIALKALLPYYAGQVKCIYIDPPYNTGNENWVYNDAVNSPGMREWLGQTVGKEAEDLSRHDKWLCMMYPRLQLLRQFLREDGAIFISIDDNEVQRLRMIMDEVFGARCFVASVIWQKVFSPKSTARHFSEDHDYILVYARDPNAWRPNLIPRGAEQDKRYKDLDNDARGPWTSGDLSARNPYRAGLYSITCPSGRIIKGPPTGMYWRVSEERLKELDEDNRIWWGKTGNNVPRIKRFLSEVKRGTVPQTLWPHREVGNTQEAKKELLACVEFEDPTSVFISPKPLRLLKRILTLASDCESIVLDSFAGTGTTGHAVLQMNKQDGGSRRFIMVEMEKGICREVAAQRLRKAITGYTHTKASGKTKTVAALGGGYRYCTLSDPLFDPHGRIRDTVSFADLAAHVFFAETGQPLPHGNTANRPLLGVYQGTAFYLLYNGVLKDRSAGGGNALTRVVLRALPAHEGPKVIYGTSCRLGNARLRREGIVFRQIPYELRMA